MSQTILNEETSSTPLGKNFPLISLALGTFAQVTAEFLPVGVLPDVACAFSISEGHAGLMMTLPGLLAAIAAPGVMFVAGKTDRRNVLLFLGAMLLASSLTSMFAPNFGVMLVGRAMLGISLGASWALALAVAGRLVTPSLIHKAAAIVFAGVTAAMILGVPLGSWISETLNWRVAFAASAALALVALVMQWASLPNLPSTASLTPRALTTFLRNRRAVFSIGLILLVFASHFATYTFVSLCLNDAGVHGHAITWTLLAFGVAGLAANHLASIAVAKHLKTTLILALAMMAIVQLALPALSSGTARVALVIAWGAAWGAIPLCMNMWHREAPGGHSEAGSALFTTFVQVAIAVGSAGGGFLVDTAGLSVAYTAPAALVVIAIVSVAAARLQKVSQQVCGRA
ncbi:MFS transporter [Stenotrophomonas sp. S41]|uniref:MFS transporter n=1 Tax=Stenotrophomonas sp. S41 TaxID=2767464 RepID=UPI00190942B2|nr:MFS transporter [Stenotrophomonas sp. S41]MBK0011703.1 MFS transporter [Stenotrophomonas sp. S41]